MKITFELSSLDELHELHAVLGRLQPPTIEEPTIDELELEARPNNSLRANGIWTIKQLLAHTAGDLIKLPQMGHKSLQSLEVCLAKQGLALRGKI